MTRTLRTSLVFFFWLAACVGEGDRVDLSDDGFVQIQAGNVSAGLVVNVRSDTCLSSSCTDQIEASCSISHSGATIVIASHFAWEHTGDSSCTDDCGSMTATCALPETLPDGTYTVQHGDDTTTLEISGGAVPEACLGEHGWLTCGEG